MRLIIGKSLRIPALGRVWLGAGFRCRNCGHKQVGPFAIGFAVGIIFVFLHVLLAHA